MFFLGRFEGITLKPSDCALVLFCSLSSSQDYPCMRILTLPPAWVAYAAVSLHATLFLLSADLLSRCFYCAARHCCSILKGQVSGRRDGNPLSQVDQHAGH